MDVIEEDVEQEGKGTEFKKKYRFLSPRSISSDCEFEDEVPSVSISAYS